MKRTNLALGASVLTVAASVAIFAGVAAAQTPPPPTSGASTQPHPSHITGSVVSVSTTTNSFTLTTKKGQVTANVASGAWIVVEKDKNCVEGTLQDIQAQKSVEVSGMTTAQSGVINARVIMQGKCAREGMGGNAGAKNGKGANNIGQHVAAGSIKAINSNTITISTEKGTDVNVVTNVGTTVLNNGFQSVGTLKVGDKVEVMGSPVKNDKTAQPTQPSQTTKPEQRTLHAWVIRVVSDSTKLVTGHVESLNGNTVTLRTPKAKDSNGMTITLDSNTGYKSAQVMDKQVTVAAAAQADVKVGSVLTVEGAPSADGKSITAKAVVIMPQTKAAGKQANKLNK